MRTKLLIVAAIAASAVVSSCSKNEDAIAPNKTGETKAVKIALNYAETRAIEGHPTNVVDNINSLTILAQNTAGQTLTTINLSAAEIKTATGGGAGLQVNIDENATQIEINANENTASSDINDFQTLVKVPYNGNANIDKSHLGTSTDPYVAAVTINPLLARFEVIGSLKSVDGTTSTLKNNVKSVELQAAYINNIKLTKDATSLIKAESGNWGDVYKTGGDLRNMFDAITNGEIPSGKAAAYNFFPQQFAGNIEATVREQGVHIVLKVNVTYTDGKTAERYITIQTFKQNSSLTNNFEAGKIYRLNLDEVAKLFTDKQDPTTGKPEQTAVFTNVKITVTDWTVVDVLPSI